MERAFTERPSPLHPLAGANFQNFFNKYFSNRPYEARSLIPRSVAIGVNLARFPFYKYQSLKYDRKVLSANIEQGPIFIVGHWRSGTTHLHNIMSEDPQFGWVSFIQTVMPWDMILEEKMPLARRMIDKELPEKRGTDNVALSIDSPQEEEWAIGNLNELSFFNCYYFPRNYEYHFRRGVLLENTSAKERKGQEKAYERLVKTLHYVHKGKPLLFKNPSATARLPMLKKLFPNARFVNIVRNPYAVYASSLARYPRLMSAFSWQKFTDINFEDHTFLAYETLMKKYLADRDQIPSEDLIETSYEKLVENPLQEINRIYSAFDLPLSETSQEKIQAYLDTLKAYKKNVHQLTQRQVDRIQSKWGFVFDQWPYEMPEIEVIPE
ncbi:MAG: sulfotransferase [Verrucomicrobiota bacterium]